MSSQFRKNIKLVSMLFKQNVFCETQDIISVTPSILTTFGSVRLVS